MPINQPPTMQLEGAALDAARNFRQIMEKHQQDMQKLGEEFETRKQAINEESMAAAKAEWEKIVAPYGLDAEETWTQGTWFADLTYLEEHGHAYLRQNPNMPGGASAAMASSAGKPN